MCLCVSRRIKLTDVVTNTGPTHAVHIVTFFNLSTSSYHFNSVFMTPHTVKWRGTVGSKTLALVKSDNSQCPLQAEFDMLTK